MQVRKRMEMMLSYKILTMLVQVRKRMHREEMLVIVLILNFMRSCSYI
jgi:hypothetical protein